MILTAAGGAQLVRALFYGAFDSARCGGALALLAAGFLLYRDDRRRKRLIRRD